MTTKMLQNCPFFNISMILEMNDHDTEQRTTILVDIL